MHDLKVNEQIKSSEVMLILENGEKHGVVSRSEALAMADDEGWDLVQVSPARNGQAPVCKMADYGKMKYKQSKKEKKQQHHITVKEIRVNFAIDEHDLATKNNQVKNFLKKGHKVKYVLQLKGRQRSLFGKEDLTEKINSLASEFLSLADCDKPAFSRDSAIVMMHPKTIGK
jgi:translation initiation factor IF-3